jgi:hypothetical protein
MLFNDNRTIRKEPPKVKARLPTLTIVKRVTINVTTITLRRNRG